MKWIGQHIYDLVSRFRGDVYINSDLYIHQAVSVGGGYAAASTDHRILYMDNDGKVEYSADLEYDSVNEKLTIGDIDSGYAYVARTPRVSGETNAPGGWLALHAGQGTGSAHGGLVELGTSTPGSSGTSLNAITEKLILWPSNTASGFAGDGAAFGGLTNPDYTQVTMPGSLGIYADTSSDLGSHPHIVFGPRTNTAQAKATPIGEIEAKGMNSAQELISYSSIKTTIAGTTGNNIDTDEHAEISIKVATSDGSTSALQNAFGASGHGTDNDVDVSIGYGATSTTTIAGDLSVTTGLILDSVDITTIQTSAESFADNDTSLMTSAAIDDRIVAATSSTFVDLTSEVSGTLPVANGGTGASSLTDNKLLTGTGTSAVTAEANATYDGADLTLTSATSTKPILSIENTTQDANAGELRLIGRRSADASVIAGIGDDTGTISFIGENAKSGPDPETITYGRIIGENYAVTDGAEMGKMSMSVGVNQSAIGGSLGFMDFLSSYASVFGEQTTFGSGGLMSTNTFDATITNFTSSVATGPIFGVYNYTDDASGPQFTIGNLRGGIGGSKTDGSDSDSCGVINFAAYDDGTPTQTTFAKIEGIAKDVSNGAEEGKLTLNVASHDGEIQPGLTIESGDAEDEVDVTIGNGSASVVTVPGFISIGGHTINDIDVAGEFVDSDEHLMTAAAINDQFGGGGGGVTADPFSTTVIKVLPNQWIINDDAGRPLFVEDDTSNTLGVRCFTTTDEMYAWQKLPSGYKATHVQVHASASTSSAVSVRSYNYQTGADNAVSATTGDLNANIDITDIPSSATQDLVIKVSPASGSTIVYGATVTIATI